MIADAFPAAIVSDLQTKGFTVEVFSRDFAQRLGLVQAVQFDPAAKLFRAAADPGYDGTAASPPARENR
jgi:hypothetical protein